MEGTGDLRKISPLTPVFGQRTQLWWDIAVIESFKLLRRIYDVSQHDFNARMEQYIAEIKSVPLAKGYDQIFYPGEMEANNNIANRRDGLALPDDTLVDLARIARECGLESQLPFVPV